MLKISLLSFFVALFTIPCTLSSQFPFLAFFITTSLHREYFTSKVEAMSMTADPTNHTKAFGGLQFFFQLRAVMDVIHMVSVALVDCVNRACHRYICYVYKCGFLVAEFCKMMQHQQPGRIKCYMNVIMFI
jgi:hypothetical protein